MKIGIFFVYLYYSVKCIKMSSIILNKIQIIPNASDVEEYDGQIDAVCKFCRGIEDGVFKAVCFSKIKPMPNIFKEESKEEDDWILSNWGARSKALNCRWEDDDEIIFETITYPAIPIFEIIAKKFPLIDFNFIFSNKDIGKTTVQISSKNGKISFFRKYKDFSKEAFGITFHMNPETKNKFIFNPITNTYIRKNILQIKMAINNDGFFKDKDGTIMLKNYNNVDELPF